MEAVLLLLVIILLWIEVTLELSLRHSLMIVHIWFSIRRNNSRRILIVVL